MLSCIRSVLSTSLKRIALRRHDLRVPDIATTESARGQRYRFFILTGRDPRTDFRRPLVEALRANFGTYYIWVKRYPVIAGPGADDSAVQVSAAGLANFMLRFRRDDRINIYINSTSTAFPFYTAFLRLLAPVGVWCFDLHDDLLYHYAGIRRLRAALGTQILRLASDVSVHASPILTELVPELVHLGNASHLGPLVRNGGEDRVLVLASFDERFDAGFLDQVAARCPTMNFDLYGWTRDDDERTRSKIRDVCKHANVAYCGPYALDDLPAILAAYRICFAPFAVGIRMTRYIDPLRFYHCLNSGMEVVSTAIPQAEHMRNWIHVAHDPVACAETLLALRAGKLAKLDAYAPITWQQKIDRLIEIVSGLPRTVRLAATLPRP